MNCVPLFSFADYIIESKIGDKDFAKCQFCSWKTDHPKAFRMRAHVVTCDAIPDETKARLESWQAAKEDKKAMKDDGNISMLSAVDLSTPLGKKIKRDISAVVGQKWVLISIPETTVRKIY